MVIPENRRASTRQAAFFGLIEARRFTPQPLRFLGIHWLLAGVMVPITVTVGRASLLIHEPTPGHMIGCHLMPWKPPNIRLLTVMLGGLTVVMGWALWTLFTVVYSGAEDAFWLLIRLIWVALAIGGFAMAVTTLRERGSYRAIEDYLEHHQDVQPISIGSLASWPPGHNQLEDLATDIEEMCSAFDREGVLVAVARNKQVKALYERFGFIHLTGTRGMIRPLTTPQP